MGQEVLLLKDADLARFRNRNIGLCFNSTICCQSLRLWRMCVCLP
jgi:hypothetical protein